MKARNYFALPGLRQTPKFQSESFYDFIRNVCCEYCSITTEQFYSKSRVGKIPLAREICCYFLRSKTSLTLYKIADFIGGKNHATVIHGATTVTNQMHINKTFRKDIVMLTKIIEKQSQLPKDILN